MRNFALQPQRNVKPIIVIRYTAIHNDVWDAALRSLERKRGSRIHGQCGTHRHNKVRFLSCLIRPLKSIGIKSLAEADGRRFQKATAVATWCLAMSAKIFEVRFGISPFVAILTLHQGVRPVQFNQAVGTGSCFCMQPVDVLSKNHQKLPGTFQFYCRVMNCVRMRVTKDLPAFQLGIPMFYSRRFRTHEIVVVNGFAPRPYTLRATEIGNSTGG